jgi:hypothetical protein
MSNNETTARPAFDAIFEFAPSETYNHKVTVETPNKQGGWDKSTFTAEFLRVEIDDYQAMVKQPPAEVLEKVLVGWDGLRAADRRSFVDYTPEHKTAFLRVPQAVLATFQVFVDTQHKARAKN